MFTAFIVNPGKRRKKSARKTSSGAKRKATSSRRRSKASSSAKAPTAKKKRPKKRRSKVSSSAKAPTAKKRPKRRSKASARKKRRVSAPAVRRVTRARRKARKNPPAETRTAGKSKTPLGAMQTAAKVLKGAAALEQKLADSVAESARLSEALKKCEAGGKRARVLGEELKRCTSDVKECEKANKRLKQHFRASIKGGKLTSGEIAALKKTLVAKDKKIAALKRKIAADIREAQQRAAVAPPPKASRKKGARKAATKKKRSAGKRGPVVYLGGKLAPNEIVQMRKPPKKACAVAPKQVKCVTRPSASQLAGCVRAAASWRARGKKGSNRKFCGAGTPSLKQAAKLGGHQRHPPRTFVSKTGLRKPGAYRDEEKAILARYKRLPRFGSW